MPSKPTQKEIPSADNEDAVLNPVKYLVYKWEDPVEFNGKEVSDCFVLRPEHDPAAMQALRTYAVACRAPEKQKAIIEWLDRIERDIVPQWRKGEHLGSMGRINAGLDKLV